MIPLCCNNKSLIVCSFFSAIMQHMLVMLIMFRKFLNKIYLLMNTHLSNGQKPMRICMRVDLFKV